MATQTKKKKTDRESGITPLRMRRNSSLSRLPTRREPNRPRNIEALRVLREWDNFTPEEIEEQKETWAFLKEALDEDRLSPDRPHFPAKDDAS